MNKEEIAIMYPSPRDISPIEGLIVGLLVGVIIGLLLGLDFREIAASTFVVSDLAMLGSLTGATTGGLFAFWMHNVGFNQRYIFFSPEEQQQYILAKGE